MAFTFPINACLRATISKTTPVTASNRLFSFKFLNYRSLAVGSYGGTLCRCPADGAFTRRRFDAEDNETRKLWTNCGTKQLVPILLSACRTSSSTGMANQHHQYGCGTYHVTNHINKNNLSIQSPQNVVIGSSCCRYYCSDRNTPGKDGATSKGLDNILTIPNVLTIIRMALAPVLGYLVLQESFLTACSVFIIAGSTDLLDGSIARRFPSQISALGSFIDPLADKLLVSVLYVTLTMVKLIPLWLAALVISRDVLLLASGFYVRYISLPPPKTLSRFFDITNVTAQLKPMFISKVNTALQLGLVSLALAAPVFNFTDHSFFHLLWYLTASTTVCSGLGYIFAKDTFKVLQHSKKKDI